MKILEEGAPLSDDQDRVPPNYPLGYRYEPWSIEDIMECMRAGEPVKLGAGDWS